MMHYTDTEQYKGLDLHGVAIVDQAADFVTRLDRTRMGEFATDDHIFLWMHVMKVNMTSYVNASVDRLASTQLAGTTFDQQMTVQKEVMFWWSRFGDKMMRDYTKTLNEDNAAHTKRYAMYYDYPQYHDYFRVGMTDLALIARCHADGVDPELAMSLVVSA